MTDYTALADRIVALGVGEYVGDESGDFYLLTQRPYLTADQFIHSWEVAGSLIEKRCAKEDVDLTCGRQKGKWWAAIEDYGNLYFSGEDKSLPHAINVACVEALEAA